MPGVTTRFPKRYYRGPHVPPYQMSVLQYFDIVTTIVSIPHKPIRDGLERLGTAYVDDATHYNEKGGLFVLSAWA